MTANNSKYNFSKDVFGEDVRELVETTDDFSKFLRNSLSLKQFVLNRYILKQKYSEDIKSLKKDFKKSMMIFSNWILEFSYESPSDLCKALRLVTQEDFEVDIINNNELGYWIWSIQARENGEATDFWLNSFHSKEEAIEFCKMLYWKIYMIEDHSDDRTKKLLIPSN